MKRFGEPVSLSRSEQVVATGRFEISRAERLGKIAQRPDGASVAVPGEHPLPVRQTWMLVRDDRARLGTARCVSSVTLRFGQDVVHAAHAEMAEHILKSAPAGAELKGWRY